MNKYFVLIIILAVNLPVPGSRIYAQTDYLVYHKEILRCEQLISEHKFKEAIANLDSLFSHYDFVFLRDCKMAAQLSAFNQDSKSGFSFLMLGISNGWTLKSIKKGNSLGFFQGDPQWKNLLSKYDSLHNKYLERLDISLREQVHKMFKKDQKKAFKVLFRIGQKSQDKYAEKKFAPHSQKQLDELNEILTEQGYPGEQLIGNNLWASVILSHHNSISKEYALKDTAYLTLKPKLINAIIKGELYPYEFAVIQDWRTAALNNHDLTSYGFLGKIPSNSALEMINRNREQIGLRSIKLRNTLIDIEKETGMNLYLPKDWQKGKITVTGK